MGDGTKKEGVVPKSGMSQNESMIIATAGQCNSNGPTKKSLSKVDLKSGSHDGGKSWPRT